MNLKNKRIFVSGGSGVIGRYLVDKLYKEGAIIYVGDLQPRPSDWSKDIIYRQGDLNNLTTAEITDFSPEYFFHLAATFERSVENYSFWEENFKHNINLSHHLISLLKDLPSLKKVIFASSYLIYDPSLYQFSEPNKSPISLIESDPIYPRNLTGSAKLNHEVELKFLSNFLSKNYISISARIYRSYGFGSRDVISRWVRQLLRKEEIESYNVENCFDFIYAEDVAEGLIRLAVSCKEDCVVNLGRGKSRAMSEVISILQSHFPLMKVRASNSPNNQYEFSQAEMGQFRSLTSWMPSKDLEEVIPQIIVYEKMNTDSLEEKPANILVTSISNKIPLLRAVKIALSKASNSKGKLYGGDSNRECLGQYFVDYFWTMPNLSSLTVKELLKYCIKNDISMIIPTRDAELLFFAKHRDALKKKGINVMISDLNTVMICSDKYEFYQHSLKYSYPAILTQLSSSEIKDDSLVVKERYGSGSRKIGLNISRQESLSLSTDMDNPIYQPFIKGEEISIDVYIDKSSRVKGIIMRKRDFVVDGESQVTTTYHNPGLKSIIEKFLDQFAFYGHIMLQVIEDDIGKFHIIECNPRFGGASTLSIAAGLDSFYWFILESLGHDLTGYKFIETVRRLRQIRFKEDLVITI